MSVATVASALTDTGYKAPRRFATMYAECVGTNPVSVSRSHCRHPPPQGPFSTIPTAEPVVTQTPPAPSDLPDFDASAVMPSATTGWHREGTACLGGLDYLVPPTLTAVDAFSVGWYATGAGAAYRSTDGSVKVDVSYNYTLDDAMTRLRNGSPGNGAVFRF